MAISKEELIKKIGDWRKGNKVDDLSDAYLEYLDSVLEKEGYDTFATDPDTGEELDDYTPEFEATQAEVLDDLGLSDREIEMIMNGEWPNPNAVPWPKKPHGDTLVIGGTDIFKEPFTEEQLAILHKDGAYIKLTKDELAAIQAADRTKAKTIYDAKIKRARELLEGSGDSGTYLNSMSDGDGLDYYRYGPYTDEDEAKLNSNPEYLNLSEKIASGKLSGKPIEKLREEIGPLMSKQQKLAIDILRGSSSDKPHDTGLADSQTLSDERFKNITNRLAKNLSKHRW